MAKKKLKKTSSLEALQEKYEGSGIAAENQIDYEDQLWVPCSDPTLTYLLGGGACYGRIIEISGQESSGKCHGLDTRLFIKGKGIIESRDLGTDPIQVITEEGPQASSGLVDTGTIKTLTLTTRLGYKITVGYDNHRLKTYSTSGEWDWKYAKNFRVGDLLPIQFGMKAFGPPIDVEGYPLDKDMAYVIGCLMGDGHVTDNHITISAAKEDVQTLEFIRDWFNDRFLIQDGATRRESTSKIHNKRGYLTYSRVGLKSFLAHFPEIIQGSHDKRVPKLILQGTREVQEGFLQGYFDTDGSASSKTVGVSISSVNPEAMRDVQQMLLNLGILSMLTTKKTSWISSSTGDRKYGVTTRLTIRGYAAYAFREHINFRLKRKALLLEGMRKTHRSTIFQDFEDYSNFDHARVPLEFYPVLESLANKARLYGTQPYYKESTGTRIALLASTPIKHWLYGKTGKLRTYLKKSSIPIKNLEALLEFWEEFLGSEPEFKVLKGLCQNMAIDEVVSIETGINPTRDLEVDNTNSYIGNGFINHNTLLAMDLIKNAQELGGVGIFVDAELAFSHSWAELNGIELDDLYIFEENAIEVISDFVAETAYYYRSKLTQNEPIILVIDSVAALDTISAIQASEETSKAEMGSRAKAFYKLIRLRNRLWNRLGITVIFINQLRDKINTGFGAQFQEKHTTVGGNALKFFASQRIWLEAKKQITVGSKDKKRRVGIEVMVTMKKNKLAIPKVPTRISCIFDPNYDDLGFNGATILPDILTKEGIVTKSGNSYTFGDKVIASSRSSYETWLEDEDNLEDVLYEAKIPTVLSMQERLDEFADTNRYPVAGVEFSVSNLKGDDDE